MEEGKRIPGQNQKTTGFRDGQLAVYNPYSDKTEKANPQELLGADRASFDWQSDTTYAIDDIVLLQGLTVWKSLQNGNTGNTPSENTYWTQLDISEADGITLTTHQNGVFTYNDSVIQVGGAIYFLDVAAPFESSDFAAELINGDWTAAPLSPQDYVDNIPQTTPPTFQEARFYYDDVKKNFVFYNDRPNVSMDLGRELWVRSINKTGSGATNGKVVYISGASGGLPEMSLAQADSEATARVLAVFTEDVSIDGSGEATAFGLVNDVDTSAWTVGTLLYLSETTAGGLTDAIPSPPNVVIPVAFVLEQNATTGKLFINVGDLEPPINRSITSAWSAFSGSTAATNWLKGYYTFAGTAITPSGVGNTLGTANVSYAAHVYFVLGSASTNMIIRVTGTSISDDTTRTPADTEDVDTSGGVLSDYFETSKKFIGQVTITLLSGTGVIVDYGWSAYWDNRNTQFVVTSFEWVGRGGANDSSPNIRLFHHKLTGWTYTGTGATPPTALVDMQQVHNTEYQIANDQYFKFKVVGLSQVIRGDLSEGILIGVDITANNAVANSNAEVQIIGN